MIHDHNISCAVYFTGMQRPLSSAFVSPKMNLFLWRSSECISQESSSHTEGSKLHMGDLKAAGVPCFLPFGPRRRRWSRRRWRSEVRRPVKVPLHLSESLPGGTDLSPRLGNLRPLSPPVPTASELQLSVCWTNPIEAPYVYGNVILPGFDFLSLQRDREQEAPTRRCHLMIAAKKENRARM